MRGYAERLWFDISHSFRALRRSRGFTAVVLATLTLGIGANASVFAVLNRLLLQSPPGVVHPDEVRRVHEQFTVAMTHKVLARDAFSFREVEAVRNALPGQTVAGYAPLQDGVDFGTGLREVGVTSVVGDYFRTLEVQPATGRPFSPAEFGRNGPARVAIISDRVWRADFRANPAALGRTIHVAQQPFTVIGVAPPDFRGVDIEPADVWIPFNAAGDSIGRIRQLNNVMDMRLTLLVNVSDADLPLTGQRVSRALKALNIVGDGGAIVSLAPLADALRPQSGKATVTVLRDLQGAALAILLIAVANVTALLLMRVAHRRRELAIRTALGSSRARIAAQLISESTMLAIAAAALALLMSYWASIALRQLLLPGVDQQLALVNWRVVVMTIAGAVAIGALIGVLISLFARDNAVSDALRTGGLATSRGGSRVREGMLVVQIALSIVLLSAAGMFVRSFQHVASISIGYDGHDVLIASIENGRFVDQRIPALIRTARGQLTHIPGVAQVAASSVLPLSAMQFAPLFLPGRDSLPTLFGYNPALTAISGDFIGALHLRVLRGRALEDDDRDGSEPVVVVSESMAQQFWPGQDPLQHCLIVGNRTSACRRVVGVVEDAHTMHLIESRRMRYYLPLAQMSGVFGEPRVLILRTHAGAPRQVRTVSQQLLDASAPPGYHWQVQPFSDLLSPELHPWETSASLFAALGLLALCIAAVGIYGTVAYAAQQRTREIGIRRALGAGRDHIVALVMLRVIQVAACGVVLGLAIVAVSGRAVVSLLYDVSPYDPTALVAAVVALMLASGLACVVPLRRAIRTDPTIALAAE
jgi:putative ABC transport system permease protein